MRLSIFTFTAVLPALTFAYPLALESVALGAREATDIPAVALLVKRGGDHDAPKHRNGSKSRDGKCATKNRNGGKGQRKGQSQNWNGNSDGSANGDLNAANNIVQVDFNSQPTPAEQEATAATTESSAAWIEVPSPSSSTASEASEPSPTEQAWTPSSVAQEPAPTTSQSWISQDTPSDEWKPAEFYQAEPSPSPTPQPQAAEPHQPSENNGGNSGGSWNNGKATFYPVSEHWQYTCDWAPGGSSLPHQSSDFVVALSRDHFGGDYMDLGKCGQTISVQWNDGPVQTATVIDGCASCDWGWIDLSPALFQALGADLSIGVLGNGGKGDLKWKFN